MIDAAIVGLGGWGRMHVRACAGSARIRFVRAVDVAPDAAADFAAEHALALGDDYAAVLADPAVAAVVLATPHTTHAGQIVAAAEAGKHVLVEKPFTMVPADAVRAADACRAAGVTVSIGHNMRFDARNAAIKELIDAGTLGKVIHLEANYSHDVLRTIAGWRHDAAEAPVGGLVHMGIHLIDLFNHFAGPIAEAQVALASHVLDHDAAAALLRLASGATGYIANITATPFSTHLQVYGEDGWARHDGSDAIALATRDGGAARRTFAPHDQLRCVRLNDENFADAIAGAAPNMFAPDELAHEVFVLDAIVRAARSGTTEAVG